jgi:DNA-binding transcriptional MocR family regulator
VARSHFEADGIDASNLAVVSGALDGVERIFDTSLRAGDRVAVEDPGYPPLFDLLTAMDLRPEPMSVDEFGVQPDALAAAIVAGSSAVVFVPRAQVPTGAAWDSTRAVELGRILASAPDLLVIEDDHAGAVAGAPALSVASGRPRWASIRSVSKSLGPDLRLAVVAGDAVTTTRVEGRHALGAGWVSYLLQDTVAELWRDPAVADLMGRAAAVYASRRGQLISALADRGIAAKGKSGLAVWVPVADEPGTTSALLHRGWAVAPGERFRIASGPGIRIGVATLTAAEIEQLAADLYDTLRQRPRRTD